MFRKKHQRRVFRKGEILRAQASRSQEGGQWLRCPAQEYFLLLLRKREQEMPENRMVLGKRTPGGCSGLWAAPQDAPFRTEVSFPRHVALSQQPSRGMALSAGLAPLPAILQPVSGDADLPRKPTWDNFAGSFQLWCALCSRGGLAGMMIPQPSFSLHSVLLPSLPQHYGSPFPVAGNCRKIISEPALQ